MSQPHTPPTATPPPPTRAERWAVRENRRRQAAYAKAYTAWLHDDHELDRMLTAARSFTGSTPPTPWPGLTLKRRETIYLTIPHAWQVESPRLVGLAARGYTGFSYTATRERLRAASGGRGTIVPGVEPLKISDQGALIITSERAVFLGAQGTREWAFSKQVAVEHDQHRALTLIHVTNRKKVSGFAYPPDAASSVRFNHALAHAHHAGAGEHLIAALEQERQALATQVHPPQPVTAADAPTPAAALGQALKTIYFGKPTLRPGSRVAQSLVAFTVTALIIAGILPSPSDPASTADAARYPGTSTSSTTTWDFFTTTESTTESTTTTTSPSAIPYTTAIAKCKNEVKDTTYDATFNKVRAIAGTALWTVKGIVIDGFGTRSNWTCTVPRHDTPDATVTAMEEIEEPNPLDAFDSSGSSDSSDSSDSSGASALCNDGTYSYSQHRRGTCSHHQGVAMWLKDLPA